MFIKAYKKWEAEHGKEPLLPGLKYNQDQLFFINFAQMFCSKYSDDHLKAIVREGPHSPSEFRINGPTSNLDEFSIAYIGNG